MNHAYHCFHYYSVHKELSIERGLFTQVICFFWDKASYYWGLIQNVP